MSQRTKDVLKTYFETYDKPTEQEFADLIDSLQQTISQDGLPILTLSSNDDGSVSPSQVGVCLGTFDVGDDYDPFDEEQEGESKEYEVSNDLYKELIPLRDSLKVPFFIFIQKGNQKALIPLSYCFDSSSDMGGSFYGIVHLSKSGYSHCIEYNMCDDGVDNYSFFSLNAAGGGGDYLPLTGGTLTGDLNVEGNLNVGGTTVQASNGHIVLPSGVEIY